MTDNPIVFQTTFEDVLIQFTAIDVRPSSEIPENQTKQTNVANILNMGVDTIISDKGKIVSGDIKITLMNQGNDFNMLLFISCNFIASSEKDKSGKSVFNKLIRFLFGWAADNVRNNKIKDKNGEEFIVPEFGYSIKDYWNVED